MATCFCKQPCDKHKFPVATGEDWVKFMIELRGKPKLDESIYKDMLGGGWGITKSDRGI